ncbi:MAG: hypothetical protein ACT4QC_10755 [Planctomycetaceae bacterium]
MPGKYGLLRPELCLLLLTVVSAGCGGDPYQNIAVVSGRVTCNDKPAVGGFVIFNPVDAPKQTGREAGVPGRSSYGRVNDDGTFSLVLEVRGKDAERPGALVGRHAVVFKEPRTAPLELDPRDLRYGPEIVAQIKAKAARENPVYEPLDCDNAITPTDVEVKSGKNEFTFTLAPDPTKPSKNAAAKRSGQSGFRDPDRIPAQRANKMREQFSDGADKKSP